MHIMLHLGKLVLTHIVASRPTGLDLLFSFEAAIFFPVVFGGKLGAVEPKWTLKGRSNRRTGNRVWPPQALSNLRLKHIITHTRSWTSIKHSTAYDMMFHLAPLALYIRVYCIFFFFCAEVYIVFVMHMLISHTISLSIDISSIKRWCNVESDAECTKPI